MGAPRSRKPGTQALKDKRVTNAVPDKQELVLIQLTIPGYKAIQGVLSKPLDNSPVPLDQIIGDAHGLIRELFLNLQRADGH